jgi:hypothetical protein
VIRDCVVVRDSSSMQMVRRQGKRSAPRKGKAPCGRARFHPSRQCATNRRKPPNWEKIEICQRPARPMERAPAPMRIRILERGQWSKSDTRQGESFPNGAISTRSNALAARMEPRPPGMLSMDEIWNQARRFVSQRGDFDTFKCTLAARVEPRPPENPPRPPDTSPSRNVARPGL